MFVIEITETVENKLDLSDILRQIADLIEAGNTCGSDPNWNINLK